MSSLHPTLHISQQLRDLEDELDGARQALAQAEAELGAYQAEVNRFRMHCRLKLDDLIDQYQALQTEKQTLYTRLQLQRQAQDMGIPFDEEDPFWQGQGQTEPPPSEDDPPLPTDTPRDKAAEKRLYRQLVRRFHPDLATTSLEVAYRTSVMAAINTAYTHDNIQLLYDLAGELDPAELAGLAAIEDVTLRQKRQLLLKIRRRQRKVASQMQSLREEKTARLWARAQELEQGGLDWWEPVRREIVAAIGRRQAEIAVLENELAGMEA